MTWKDKENRLIALMENRTTLEDGLTIDQLCKEVLGIVIKKTPRRSRGGKRKGYYLGEMDEVDLENWEKSYIARTQLKALLRRVRKKYLPEHQYHIVPWFTNVQRYFEGMDDATYKYKEPYNMDPATISDPHFAEKEPEDKFFGYRCVHIIPIINEYFLYPSWRQRRKTIDTIKEHIKQTEMILAKPQEEIEQAAEDSNILLTLPDLTPTKEEIKKAVVELKREKTLPWKGYKPNYKGIAHVFGREISKKMRLYGGDIDTLYFGGANNEERRRILKDIVICDFEKKDYVLRYDWELLQYLANQQGHEKIGKDQEW
ncbi:MAG: hypothetical protein ACR2IS_00245 [Nitrososphaeraceae archaeon]